MRNQSAVLIPVCRVMTPARVPCEHLKSPCKMMNPCPENMICIEDLTEINGYKCEYSSNFTYSACEPNPCWNHGTSLSFLTIKFII